MDRPRLVLVKHVRDRQPASDACSLADGLDGPVLIGQGQTISQPFIVALMTDLAAAKFDDTVLEVGTGSGYRAAVLARLVRKVCTVEIIPPLAETAANVLKELGYDNVSVKPNFHIKLPPSRPDLGGNCWKADMEKPEIDPFKLLREIDDPNERERTRREWGLLGLDDHGRAAYRPIFGTGYDCDLNRAILGHDLEEFLRVSRRLLQAFSATLRTSRFSPGRSGKRELESGRCRD